MSKSRDISNYGSIVGGLVGELKMWPTSVAPDGYLLCDGSAVSRTTYSTLFTLFGTTFGSGNGSTTFNIPDYRDRMPIGAGNLYPAANTGGSKDSIVVSHTHDASTVITDPGHAHTAPYNGNGTGGQPSIGYSGGDQGSVTGTMRPTYSSNTGITASVTNSSTGSSGTNANLPPYLGIHFIIRYL